MKTQRKTISIEEKLDVISWSHKGERIVDLWRHFFVIKPTRFTHLPNLFWHETLHVSDGVTVHHQQFIHCTLRNGICLTGL